MFGHDDDNAQNDSQSVVYGGPPADDALGMGSSHAVVSNAVATTTPPNNQTATAPPVPNPEPKPITVVDGNDNPPSNSAGTNDQNLNANNDTPTEPPSVQPDSDDLLSIKQAALQQLSPLVSQLDQTPEEKFRTIMMMIQAADNQSLIKNAYEAAKEIGDEKARAQALLDIVNEINYFTHGKHETE